ncbi:phosphatidate cytidylyltransferase [Thorsellia kenyensis]|uniref:Phosphatidate cytidylyltransferase n=1 Tax=Thorsellia kenyensis TaxID=1549888 RepID=A0ABV6CAR8_9GAMM
MFKQRLISSLILIPIAILSLFYFKEIWFTAMLAMIGGLAVWEWSRMMKLDDPRLRIFLGGLFTASVILIAVVLNPTQKALVNHMILSISVGWWIAAIGLVLTYPKSSMVWEHGYLLKVLFIFFILLPFIVAMVELRDKSPWWVLYVLVLVWTSDTGAYLVGKKWGKHKMAPKVSPGKTWQGFAGAIVLSSLLPISVSVLYPQFIEIKPIIFVLISLITVIVSVFGDLAESMFKRNGGIKDSSNLIPGHGGVLDRIDSLTAAVPIFFVLFQYIHNLAA